MNKNLKRKWLMLLALVALLGGSDALPASAGDFSWSGDIRVRNENMYTNQVNRNRVRFRTGFKTSINDYLEANVRLSTGAGGNTSTNQNFTQYNIYPAFWDLAYVTYRPTLVERLKIHAGKMKNFFTTTPLLWDSDTNPDGLGQEYNMGSFIFRAAQWGQVTNVADNTGFYSYQAGWLGDTLEFFVSNYVDTSSTVGTAGNYLDYLASYVWGPFKLTADFASETNTKKSGYWVTLDWNKVKTAGDLAIKLGYAHLDDGFAPDLRDSDFNDGATATLGNEGPFTAVAYGLEESLEVSATYYGTSRKTDSVNTNHLLLDLVAKF